MTAHKCEPMTPNDVCRHIIDRVVPRPRTAGGINDNYFEMLDDIVLALEALTELGIEIESLTVGQYGRPVIQLKHTPHDDPIDAAIQRTGLTLVQPGAHGGRRIVHATTLHRCQVQWEKL